MTPEQLNQYLVQWMNKAVQKGGFSAQEAADGLNALGQLTALAEKKTDEKPKGGNK